MNEEALRLVEKLRGLLLDVPCCGNFRECKTPCVPRAEHWKEIALNAGAEELASLARVQPQGEPVAWLYRHNSTGYVNITEERAGGLRRGVGDGPTQYSEMPLYSSPPAQEVPEGLRQSAMWSLAAEKTEAARQLLLNDGLGCQDYISGYTAACADLEAEFHRLSAAPKPGGKG